MPSSTSSKKPRRRSFRKRGSRAAKAADAEAAETARKAELFSFETDLDVLGSDIPYMKQGDTAFDKPRLLKQRGRIKKEPEFVAAVNLFWQTYQKSDRFTDTGALGISQEEYVRVHLKMTRLLTNEFHPASAYANALAD
jgi:hypothetical protein